MYHHSCQPCSQPSQNAPANSLSDFFPAGYRVSSAHERFPYYISVPVYLEEENNCGSCGGCGCNSGCNSCCSHCSQSCYCPCSSGMNTSCPSSASSSPSCGYNRIRCTTRFCR